MILEQSMFLNQEEEAMKSLLTTREKEKIIEEKPSPMNKMLKYLIS